MEKKIYSQFEFAKKKRNLKIMETLYYENPKEEIIKFEYAKLLIERNFIEDGKQLLLELLNTSNSDYATLELGKLESFAGNIEEARKYFKKLVHKNDQYGKLELGILEMHQGNYELARKLFTDLVINKDDYRAKLELARLENMTGNKDIAHETLSSLSEEGDRYVAKFDLGMLEREKGHLDEAKKIFISLFDKPNGDKAKFEVAKIESEIGNINEARFYFQELIGTGKDMHSRFELARLESRVCNFDKARKLFEDLYEETKSDYVLIELGMLEYNSGNIDKSKTFFKSLIETKKDEYAYRLLLLIETKEQHYLEAFKLIREMLKLGYSVSMHVALSISKELNIFFEDYNYKNHSVTYCNNQIIEYKTDEALKHIYNHHCNNSDMFCFNKNLDISNLFNTYREELDEKYKVNYLCFNDIYFFPYENIGRSSQKYLKVVTLPNSNNIISMYPTHSKYEVSDDDEELEVNKIVLMRRGGK